jgi:branched-chain amino acid transport system permease protein
MTIQQVIYFALSGLGSGALIAGLALGVVLTYRGSGIINLATGAVPRSSSRCSSASLSAC